jgi:large subunit ribosomal protein L10
MSRALETLGSNSSRPAASDNSDTGWRTGREGVVGPNDGPAATATWRRGCCLAADWRQAVERAEKRELVGTLNAAFKDTGVIVVAHYQGLTVADMQALRARMREAGGKVKVAKNRLAKLALKETDTADISALFTGPTVVAFAKDPMTAPKVASAFADKNQKFVVLGGAMGKTGLDANNVKALATMPSLDQLRAMLAGLLKQPATRIASILQAPGGQIARVLSAYADKGNA